MGLTEREDQPSNQEEVRGGGAVAGDPAEQRVPWSVLIFGTPGVGKSTLATHAPRPYFLDLENGLRWIKCRKTKGVLRSWEEVQAAATAAAQAKTVDTVVVDTVDQLETILTAKICREGGNKKTLADFGYGKGYEILEREWHEAISFFDHLRDTYSKNVLWLGHEKVERFEDPTTEAYDRYHVKLHKKSAGVVFARLDAVLFASFEKVVRDRENSERKIASSTGKRVLHVTEGASWVAKNRFSLYGTVPLDKSIFDHFK